METRFDVVGIGNPVYDIIETPYISTEGRVLSGCSTNACLVLSRLGLRTGLIGTIGKNYLDDFNRNMESLGIDAAVRISEDTGGFHLIYDTKGDRKLRILGVAGNIGSSDIPERFIDTRFVLIGPILGEVEVEAIDHLKEKSKAKLFLDPQGFLRRTITVNGNKEIERTCDREVIKDIVSRFNIVKPNEYEAEVMTGESDPKKAAETVYSWGADIVIVTLGERGSVIYDGSEAIDIPAYETFAKDPTGAGDTYAAGFMFEYLKKRDLRDVGLYASCTASIMVENTGPDFVMNEELVRERVEKLEKKE